MQESSSILTHSSMYLKICQYYKLYHQCIAFKFKHFDKLEKEQSNQGNLWEISKDGFNLK